MKKLFFSLCAVALLSLSSCDKYDDGPLSNRVDNLENRVKSLEEQCKQLNANITSVQTLVNAMENGDAITSVTPIKEGDKEVGYSFAFSKSPSISVYHGKDGQDGASGSAPEIGIKKDDKGNYCWTINGEWIVGEDGNKVSSTGASDSVLPEFKIDKDNWLMSADGGETWVNLGKGTADGKNAVFNDIDTTDPNKVTFTLSDGTKFELPRQAELTITLSEDKQVLVKPNTTIKIDYTIAGNTKDLYVEVITSGNVKAKIENNEATTGPITIKIGENIDEYDKLILFATNGTVTVFKSLTFKEDEYVQIIDEEESSYVANEEGGAMNLNIETNTDYSVNIPDEAKDWISVVQSRAAIQATIKLNISANSSYTRSANIVIKSVNGKILLVIQIIQKGESIIPDDMTVAFPDVNFRKYLLQNFDIDSDGKISDVEAFKVKRIQAFFHGIVSMDGIQYFPNLEYLSCGGGKRLTTLDVSKNTALTELYCGTSQLTTLDLSKNTALTTLYCHQNQLTMLDVSKNTALTVLKCSDNKLTTLDISKNTSLSYLGCYKNQLTTLDVSGCTALTTLECQHNQLTTLDVSKNTSLTHLNCYSTTLKTVYLKSGQTIQNLDKYSNTEIVYVGGAISIPSDMTVAFPDKNFRNYLIQNFDTDNDEVISDEEASRVRSIKVDNKGIYNLDGIQYFSKIERLECEFNKLSSLDLTNNTALKELICYRNELVSLDISKCTALTVLKCDNNQLTNLNLSNCVLLENLTCIKNPISFIDLSKCKLLQYLECSECQLTRLSLSNNSALQYLDCNDNQLIDLDVSKTNLGMSGYFNPLHCSMPTLKTLYIKNGWTIEGITYDRSVSYINPNTEIKYLN
ncbi:MAG: hypothetical protein K2H44_00580 [Muribaculaceae bacterium]|nr:hypothetical protein [Muribaculaceae bacterium]